MPATTPMPTKNPGDVLTSTLWNTYLRDNIDKLLTRGHRVLTVAQFAALTGLEGTKGTVAPDEVYLEVDSANGIQWHLAYESGEATYKWRYLGGPALISLVDTAETTASLSYVDIATVGPSITLPRAGDYDFSYGANLSNNGASGSLASPKLGGAATADSDDVGAQAAAFVNSARTRRFTGRSASDVIKLQYRVGGNTGTFSQRFLAITPARIV